MGAIAGVKPQFELAHRCHMTVEMHRNDLPSGGGTLGIEGGTDGGQFLNLTFPIFDQSAGGIIPTGSGTEEAKLSFGTHAQAYFVTRYVSLASFFHTKRGDTESFDGGRKAGYSGKIGGNPDVVGPCSTAADANSSATTDQAVVSRSPSDRQIEIGTGEFSGRLNPFLFTPAAEYLPQTLTQ
jgi:hypothetical protein